MIKKIYYEKKILPSGKAKYVPVSEYNSEFMDSFKKGTHLVVSCPGGKSTHYDIDPAYAPMIAAGRVAEDVISRSIIKAHEIRPYQNQALTPEQKVAWDNLVTVLGDGGRYLEWPSAREITQSAINAMSDEAIKLLENPSVKLAYDHFHLICQLTKDHHSS